LHEEPDLSGFVGRVSAPVIMAALYARFGSQERGDFADRVLAAMRYGFGGHLEKFG